MSTPILNVSNTTTNLGQLNVSFDLQGNRTKDVLVRIYSYPPTGSTPNGFRQGRVRTVAVNAFYRYSLDLSQMTAGSSLGGADFSPTASRIQFAFIMPGSSSNVNGTWQKIASNYVRVDNLSYTSPSYFAAPDNLIQANNTGLSAASPQTLDWIMERVVPSDVVCLNAGTYTNTTGNVVPFGGVTGTPSRWITIRPTDKSNPPILRTTGYNTIEIPYDASTSISRGSRSAATMTGDGQPEALANGLSIALAEDNAQRLNTNTYPGFEKNPAYTVYSDHNLSATQLHVP